MTKPPTYTERVVTHLRRRGVNPTFLPRATTSNDEGMDPTSSEEVQALFDAVVRAEKKARARHSGSNMAVGDSENSTSSEESEDSDGLGREPEALTSTW